MKQITIISFLLLTAFFVNGQSNDSLINLNTKLLIETLDSAYLKIDSNTRAIFVDEIGDMKFYLYKEKYKSLQFINKLDLLVINSNDILKTFDKFANIEKNAIIISFYKDKKEIYLRKGFVRINDEIGEINLGGLQGELNYTWHWTENYHVITNKK